MPKTSRDSVSAQAAGLPAAPGVYLFKDGRGRVLYVGKADVLRDRVRSYFGPSLDVRHVRLVERAERIDHVLTGSIAEAYLLEANLIKQHRPRYNIRLKDDKSYPYVKVTLGEDFPRILRTRQLGDRGARYFGPYANAKAVDETLDLLQKLFPYRTCKLNIVAQGDERRGTTVPPSALPGGRPCLLYHLKRCTAPCVGNVTAAEYRDTIERSVLFLEGRYEPLARELRDEMKTASASLEYERAADLRDRLRAIERTVERQEVHAYKGDDLDVFGVAVDGGDAAVQIFRVRDGKIVGRDHFFLEGAEGATTGEVLVSFLRQYYVQGEIPPEISSLAEMPDPADLVAFAESRRGARVRIAVPRRGRKRRLADLAMRNAEDALRQERVRWMADRGKTDEALRELHGALREHLEIEGPPRRIECYDVSHVQGTDVVSSMVVFEEGRPAKDQYRRFRARVTDRNDDFANMRDTIRRRFARHAKEADGKEAWPLPDLIVVDGGKGQLGAARAALSDLGLLQLPIVALAKEKRVAGDGAGQRVKPEEVFVPDRPDPVPVPPGSPAYHLLQRIRDEAHRFAVTYHQKLRGRRAVRSALDEIEGVGPARKRALLRRFGSVRGIREASAEDVAAVGGVGKALADRIKAAL